MKVQNGEYLARFKLCHDNGLHEVNDDFDMKATLANLSKKVEVLTLNQSMNHHPSLAYEVCALCSNLSHMTHNCPSLPAYQKAYSELVHALQLYGKSSNSPYLPTYNWRVTLIFSKNKIKLYQT
ncbi:hypothetical protein WN943_024459 [Citrus x changshan-huyou]